MKRKDFLWTLGLGLTGCQLNTDMSWFSALAGAGASNVNLISGYSIDFLNRYVDVSFDPNAYHSSGGGVLAADLSIVFAQNGGTATNCAIESINKTDGSALVGGENTIRVNLTLTGSASGVETIEIKPSAARTIKDSTNRFISGTDSTGAILIELTYDTNYQDVLEYAETNSITYPTKSQRLTDNTFVLGAKATGAWGEWDAAWWVANNKASTAFARINIKSPGNNTATEVGTPTWVDEIGVRASGTSYLNSNWNPLTHGVKYLQNDASVWISIATNAQAALNPFGARGSASGTSFGAVNFNPRNTSDNARWNINRNSSTPGDTIANTDSSGRYVLSRETSTNSKLYRNATQLASATTTSSTVSDKNIYICAANENGTANNFDTSRNVGFFAVGSGMQDVIASTDAYLAAWLTATNSPPTDTGRLYLLIGQSNMDGRAELSSLPGYLTGVIANCFVWWDNEWQPLQAGVNGCNQNRFGPLISFAYEESQKHTGEDLYFVINAFGGTDAAINWAPGGDKYVEALAKYSNAVNELNVTSYEAILWYQGEADARDLSKANAYEVNEATIMTNLFADTAFTKAIVCQINSAIDPVNYPYAATVRTAKTDNDVDGDYGVGGDLIETNDLSYDAEGIHLDASGCITVGERMSAAI